MNPTRCAGIDGHRKGSKELKISQKQLQKTKKKQNRDAADAEGGVVSSVVIRVVGIGMVCRGCCGSRVVLGEC